MRFIFGTLFKWIFPQMSAVPRDYSYTPTVSILLPCYNEGAAVYDSIKSIRNTDYPTDKLEIICCDDGSSDDSYEWMMKASRDFVNVQVHKNLQNMGKSRTMLRALSFSNAEMVISIDSDTVFASDTVRELMSCFVDPKIGAVGGVVGVLNVNDNFITAFQAFQYYIGFNLYKITENWSRTVGCIAGPLFAVRRSLLLSLAPLVENRNWFGQPVIDGEDRFLTHQICLAGWDTYVNMKAQCWTIAPNTLSQYFKQQLRWRRSSLRDLFLSIKLIPRHLKLHINALYVFIVLPSTAFIALLYIGAMFVRNPLFWLDQNLMLGYTALALVAALGMRIFAPEQNIKNPLNLAMFGVWWIVNSLFLTVLACFTLDSGEWGTRTKLIDPVNAAEEKILEEEVVTAKFAESQVVPTRRDSNAFADA
jgi:N-acetylglucosaminyltransferase